MILMLNPYQVKVHNSATVYMYNLTLVLIILCIGLSITFGLSWRCPLCTVGKIDIAPRESSGIVMNLMGILL